MTGQGTGQCPASSIFFKTFEIIFLVLSGHKNYIIVKIHLSNHQING